ncbi:MAG: sugar phosphate nucleotidyltransferase [Pelagibacteraceae bacterium]
MKINTALILCAGYGKRLNPITLDIPKPLLKVDNICVLEKSINLIKELGIKNILLNTFYLKEQIVRYININHFDLNIKVIDDGNEILNTGGGILNMMNNSNDENFLVFNPDTIWNLDYLNEIKNMENIFFSKNLDNLLLLVNKKLSFDQNLKGDFNLDDNKIKKGIVNSFIYTGCQILNKKLFKSYKVENFSVSRVWDDLIKLDKLNGMESKKKFYHLTNLEIFKKLQDF